MAAPLDDDIALRIGLAARELAGVDARLLLRVLIRILGEPISHGRLLKLRASRFRQALEADGKSIGTESFQRAFALLKGQGIRYEAAPAPLIESGVYCELSGSVRVACASDSGEKIDGQFGSCARFLIYQVSPDYVRLIDIREPATRSGNQPAHSQSVPNHHVPNHYVNRGEAETKADRELYRVSLIKDCAVLYTTSIGGPAAAKAVRAGVHPIKLAQAVNARDALARLQSVLAQENPPPWLAKAMGSAPRLRAHYCEANA